MIADVNIKMRRAALGALAVALGVLGSAGAAQADGWKKKGRHYHAPPGYVVVPPGHVRYYAPAPVVYAPRPVMVYPEPVMYAPAYPFYAVPPGLTINVPLR